MWIALPVLDEIVDRTLREDLHAGDMSAEATVPAEVIATGTAVARHSLVVCGGDVFQRVFQRIDPTISFERLVPDGTKVERDTKIWQAKGPAQAILMGERSALNLTQRMSGVATMARTYVAVLPEGSPTRITDTRKTTPGLRVLERYAVRCGGAFNHRDSLGAAIMIKDNHIIAAGGIAAAVAGARKRAPHTSRIEVEVANLHELEQALEAQADIILLDNFSIENLGEAVRRAKGKAILEASGGITLQTLATVAATGVDVISAGALTHSAPAADIALDLALVR